MKEKIHFIGAGNLGTTLARAMHESGYSVPVFWTKRKFLPKQASRYLPETCFKKLENHQQFINTADIVIITVPDNQIRTVSKFLSNTLTDWANKIVCHTSGSLNKEELSDLEEKSAIVGSIHPMQTFNQLFLSPDIFKNIYFAVEGGNAIIKFAENWIKKFKSKMIKIQSSQKIIYHIAAVTISNFFAGLLNYSEHLFKNLNFDKNISKEIILPIVNTTLNNFRNTNSLSSLTGPLSRGDTNTIDKHLSMLKENHKDLYPVYKEISRYILKFMLNEKTNNYKQIIHLLEKQND